MIWPNAVIEFNLPADLERQTLQLLHKRLPYKLKVSFVEYALDMFTSQVREAWILFNLFHRALTVKRAKDLIIHNPDINKSRTLHFLPDTHVYERGTSDTKVPYRDGGGWYKENIDRVRIERKVRSTQLRGVGIVFLEDLLADPEFTHFNSGRYQIKRPKYGTKLLPPWWSNDIYDGSLHAECRQARLERGVNTHQAMVRFQRFQPIIDQLESSISTFNDRWAGVPW